MKKYNLKNLLSDEIEIAEGEIITKVKLDGIMIPIIQRDYAQGREEELVIRERFLSALFEALKKDAELELDFVYGSIKVENINKKVFLPLDGQQRLTTLYLLYWFIGNKELHGQELIDLRKILLGFTYATRTTATSFCEKLAEISFNENPSEEIRKSYWFHKRFEKDPTVYSMLNMLDAIKIKYEELNKEIFNNLNKLCFYILPLDGFELTDELYIKMNARGKQLTDFENLKADLNNWLISDSNKLKIHFEKWIDYNGLLMPYYLVLLSKIDNEWTNIFWNYLLKFKKENENLEMVIDPYFMSFISRFILNNHILESSLPASEIEISTTFKFFYSEKDNIKYNSFDLHYEIFKIDGTIEKFEKILDSLSRHYDEIVEIIKPSWNKNSNWFIFDERISQQQRILFCGICLYLEKNTFNPTYFANWIRIVWNLAIDPDIRSIGAMINTIKLLKDLSEGNQNIYAFLETPEFENILYKRKDIFRSQLEEEKIKAQLISNTSWEELIMKGESHPLFQGNVGFLINDLPDLHLFKKRIENAMHLFDSSGASKAIGKNHQLFRYLISKFSLWRQIENFIYSDSDINWRLILRRNNEYQNNLIITELCSFESIDKIKEIITENLSVESSAEGWSEYANKQVRKTHTNLYFDVDFFAWIQATGSNKIKWLQDRIYIIRPGAWYDKVMIDCFRNELIALALTQFKLKTDGKKCGSSNFFKEESVVFMKNIDERVFTIIFGANGFLTINEKIHEDWVPFISSDYSKINNVDEVNIFIDKFKNEIKSNSDKELIKLLE